MPKTIALVACVSLKNPRPMPARDLYCSDWFIKARRYAEKVADQWYILSAKYGLLRPDELIEPYNVTLKTLPAVQRRLWGRRVTAQLSQVVTPGDRIIMLAGTAYREHLMVPLQRMGCRIEVPLEGLAIGEQLSWLKSKVG